MPTVKLDSTFVLTATCPEGRKKIDYYDTIITGFILEVRSSGSRTYSLRYRDEHGAQKQYKIGNAADLTFDRARREAIKLRSRVVVGEDPSGEKAQKRSIPIYAELATRYLAHVRTYQRDPETAERHMRLRIVPRWGRLRLTDIRQADVAEWLGEQAKAGLMPATVERMRVVFSHSFKVAKQWGVPGAENNPLVGIPRPTLNNARERYLTTEEAQRLRKAVEGSRNKQLKYIVGLLLFTGARVSEILKARWEDLSLETRTLRVPLSKTGKSRHVPLSQEALDLIAQLPRYDGCQYMIPNHITMKPFTNFFMSWDTARKEAGLRDVRIHDLRHAFASALSSANIDLYTIGKVLGHANYKTTMRYSHLANDTLLAAVEAGAAKFGVDWAGASPQLS